jgi:tryptophanyl-tRNA synthetase
VTRVLSCLQPTGDVHLGVYFGALRQWVAGQHDKDVFHGIVDLHALTIAEEPGVVGDRTIEVAAILFAVGLDPDVATVFVQSHVAEHSQLAWLMECNVSFGELSRMTQFKDKSAKRSGEFISGGLFTYPALMAGDILLYDTDEVPVGDDQRQHVEITRDIAIRFNQRFGETFVLPRAVVPAVGARVMDLQDPTAKMSKSSANQGGVVQILDDPSTIAHKFRRAVTDSESEVRFDPARKPGVSNLLQILAASTGQRPEDVAAGYTQYGPLKADAGDAVVEALRPIQKRRSCARAPTRPAPSPRRRSTAPTTPSAWSTPESSQIPFPQRICGISDPDSLWKWRARGQMLSSAACRSAAAGPVPRISATVTCSLPARAAIAAPIAS